MILYLIIFLIIFAFAGTVYIFKFMKRESRAIMPETPREIQPTFKIVQKPAFFEKQNEFVIKDATTTIKEEPQNKAPNPNSQFPTKPPVSPEPYRGE
jgi:flagellar basal body-associated protein FliL